MRLSLKAAGRRLIWRASPLLLLIACFWVVFIFDMAMKRTLTLQFGLVPRQLDSLTGILGMPFLHDNLEHLWLNTIAALVLGGLLIWAAPGRFWPATILIVLFGGLLVWFFARSGARHIGASALIFGWLGFVVAIGVLERSRNGLLAAILAIVFYGADALIGLSPTREGVSWEGHLAGLIGGVVAASLLRDMRSKTRWAPKIDQS